MSTAKTPLTEQRNVALSVADPTAIGLFGLAMVTLEASSQKLGITSGTLMVIPWAIFLGALAQLFAAIQDSKLGNTFGSTAFGGFGFFWLGVALSWMFQNGVFGDKLAAMSDGKQLGFAFVGYLIFSLYMTVGSAAVSKVLFIIFLLIDLLFIGLALNVLGGSEFGHTLAAYAELGIAIVSFYGSAAAVLNKHLGRVVLPTGKAFIKGASH